jgi:lysophospholipid hydrolase
MFNRGIRKRLGKIRIQDLVLNFFCVSVDLQKQKEVVFRKGLLWKYVRASMSMTGYLPPIAEDGQLLVDGAYMNSVPADVMRHQMGARIVIAIDTSEELERDHYMWGNHLSGWWVLWNSLNPFSKTVRVPSIGDLSDMVRFGLYVLVRKLMAEYSLTQFRMLILNDSFVGYLRIDIDETANCIAIFTWYHR